MKRHHIVGIIVGIVGIGLTVQHVLSASIIEALITFTMFSILTIANFLKNKLSQHPRWDHEIWPFCICVIVVCLMLLELFFYLL